MSFARILALALAFGAATIAADRAAFAQVPPPAQAGASMEETRLRALIDAFVRGAPDLDSMEGDLRRAVEPIAAQTSAELRRLGALRSVTPLGVQGGLTIFRAGFEKGTLVFGLRIGPSGKLAALVYRAQPAAETRGEEVTTAGLAGTLLKPANVEKPPVVLLIAGSGPTDRNGNQGGAGPGPLRLLAEALAERGIASLRFDKRGIGRSTSNMREDQLDLDAFVDDADAWVKFLAARSDLGPLAVAGHSEGGLIGIRLAQRRLVAGLVLLATPGRRLSQLLREQLGSALPQPLRDEAFTTLAALERGETVTNVSAPLMPLFRPSVQPFLRSEIAMDPAAELARLRVPTLVVSGGHDLQVTAADAQALAQARPDARRFDVAEMNHVLKAAPAGRAEQQAAYSDPQLPLMAGLVDAIASFVKGEAR
ncbi:MAG: alpha/beta fold hydrolase [Alphaproteobacteria bacterium]|nr:alpha/beta fold hydrolase [Alphaproteobacteria bacterium]